MKRYHRKIIKETEDHIAKLAKADAENKSPLEIEKWIEYQEIIFQQADKVKPLIEEILTIYFQKLSENILSNEKIRDQLEKILQEYHARLPAVDVARNKYYKELNSTKSRVFKM